MGSDLFVTHVDELDAARRHRGEDSDVRMSAQTENRAESPALQVAHEMIGNCVFHEARAGYSVSPL
jgi:hypothetical protein